MPEGPDTIAGITRFLELMGVPGEAYSIGVDQNETYCLIHDGTQWLTYYSERGRRSDLRRHVSERDACADLVTAMLALQPVGTLVILDEPETGAASKLILRDAAGATVWTAQPPPTESSDTYTSVRVDEGCAVAYTWRGYLVMIDVLSGHAVLSRFIK